MTDKDGLATGETGHTMQEDPGFRSNLSMFNKGSDSTFVFVTLSAEWSTAGSYFLNLPPETVNHVPKSTSSSPIGPNAANCSRNL